MFLLIFLLFIQLTKLNAIIPFDGIIHRSSDGNSYAFLSPLETGDHSSSIEQMTPSDTLVVAWFTDSEYNKINYHYPEFIPITRIIR